uniref:Vezatin n=1 Tax=Anopheles funestus TaxID=62324 RepID=A0A182RH79_ANOFN
MNNLLKRPDMTERCIWKILTSKRLLIDHLEVVEICFKFEQNITQAGIMQKPVRSRKIVCAGCLLTIAAVTRFSPSYVTSPWQIVASATSALLLGGVAYEEFFYYCDRTTITRLIKSIDLYDHTMKKMLMFMNEVIYGNQRISCLRNGANEKEMLRICTGNCIKAINTMYDYVQELEEKTELRDEFSSFYDLLETLENCDAFKQLVPNLTMAKELYNIFLYMQSHCLLRLSLAILSDLKISVIKVETNRLIDCLNSQAGELKKQLMLNGLSQMEDLVMENEIKESGLRELLSVKHHSLDLAVKLTANVQQMILIDNNIQCLVNPESWLGRLQLQNAVNNLSAVQSYFQTRMVECERLTIAVKKLLNSSEKARQHEQVLDVEPANESTYDEPISESQNATHRLQDEFFVNTGTEAEEDGDDIASGQYALQVEEELVAKRLMKKQFQPILLQLRERLVPVEESFKQRERIALELKGIIIPDEEESHDESKLASQPEPLDSDDDSDDEELEAQMKRNRSQNKYKADRDFLASKQQISFLLSIPKDVQMDESILE